MQVLLCVKMCQGFDGWVAWRVDWRLGIRKGGVHFECKGG